MAPLGAYSGQGVKSDSYVPAGNVAVHWKIDKFKENTDEKKRLTNLTFRFTVNEPTLHAAGTYFAMQFIFDSPDGRNKLAYTGLQPRASKNGSDYMRAVFSTFVNGSTSTHQNCSPGADGSPGVKCGVEFKADYGKLYKIEVTKDTNNIWHGIVQNSNGDAVVDIGSWKLPNDVGNIIPSYYGFAEYYAHYQPGYPQFVVPSCDKLAKIDVIFGPVSTLNNGGGVGSVSKAYEYGDRACRSKDSGYKTESLWEATGDPFDKDSYRGAVRILRGWIENQDK